MPWQKSTGLDPETVKWRHRALIAATTVPVVLVFLVITATVFGRMMA